MMAKDFVLNVIGNALVATVLQILIVMSVMEIVES